MNLNVVILFYCLFDTPPTCEATHLCTPPHSLQYFADTHCSICAIISYSSGYHYVI